ncbi:MULTISPECIES: ABC transporter ATP-binding protein [Shouchella]|uniref:ABC transporter ATP-binding protein n=2 Tax=Shouchella TaxID=2893057 RepID=A0ABY7W2Q6_9BACI|nr:MULTISPECIES: ABC transporter ATP-binding protein [Shouchella]MED4129787.1 ABC transporter ATP-binding protein [Shouchella miscanthi]WDF02187.1 ABC transporter ATP-binding protein [Shouchella hunanensis]GAF23093.1 ABC transporter, ATP-binding protein [Bacillus sp. JCM 19047]
MNALVEVNELNKTFKQGGFGLENISFTIKPGSIVGFIGENGAGKSTTIGSIIGSIRKDHGVVRIFGQEMQDGKDFVKEDIGVVFDTVQLPEELTIVKLERVFNGIYRNWNKEMFYSYVEQFSLPRKKKIRSFSRGMSMKVSVAVALSHDAKLLLLDEATAGLDPSGRDDLLNVLRTFVSDGKRSILLSSHITSDIEKIADSLIFIKGGRILFDIEKESLLSTYRIRSCTKKEFDSLPKAEIVAYREQETFVSVLVKGKEGKAPSIDEITVLLMRGVHV